MAVTTVATTMAAAAKARLFTPDTVQRAAPARDMAQLGN
jgi:hypothetical protein